MRNRRQREPRRPKPPPQITEEYLQRAALHYLDRYDSSAENLRRVLMRKVDRSMRAHGGDRDEFGRMVEALITRLDGAGVVNDQRYARMKAGSLHRRGTSSRVIAMKLKSKGVEAAEIRDAMQDLEPEGVDPDLVAAITWAQRRKVGPWTRAQDLDRRRELRQKQLAILARRGFSYGLCAKIIDADTPDELLELIEDADVY